MKCIYLFLSFIAAGSQPVTAQRSVDTLHAEFITLGKPGTDELIPDKMNFSGLRFIDNRLDTSNIGYVYGVRYHDEINFRNSLAVEFNIFIDSNFKRSFSDKKDSLLIIINYFRVSATTKEVPDGEEPQFVKIELLLAKKYNGLVSIMANYDDLLLCKRKTFKTKYTDCIKKAIRNVLVKANALSAIRRDPEEGLPERLFLDKYANNLEMPVLKDSNLKKGVYVNFQQLVTNSPQYPNFEYRFSSDDYFINVLDSNGVKMSRRLNYWGYCDGKKIYVCTDEGIFPLIKVGNSLTISLEPANVKASKTSARIASGFLLALAILLHSAPGGGPPGDGESLGRPKIWERIEKKSYPVLAYQINMRTGEIDF